MCLSLSLMLLVDKDFRRNVHVLLTLLLCHFPSFQTVAFPFAELPSNFPCSLVSCYLPIGAFIIIIIIILHDSTVLLAGYFDG